MLKEWVESHNIHADKVMHEVHAQTCVRTSDCREPIRKTPKKEGPSCEVPSVGGRGEPEQLPPAEVECWGQGPDNSSTPAGLFQVLHMRHHATSSQKGPSQKDPDITATA